MSDFKWLHELIFGALLANIIIITRAFGFIARLYKQYDDFWRRHSLMWMDYCKRHNIKTGREFNDRTAEDESSA